MTMVPIIQSVAQLEENYKKTGSEILMDNCQLTIAGGFTPQSETAESVSRALGNRTVLSGVPWETAPFSPAVCPEERTIPASLCR